MMIPRSEGFGHPAASSKLGRCGLGTNAGFDATGSVTQIILTLTKEGKKKVGDLPLTDGGRAE
ncbi:MAG TPA: hypothetical protein VMG10_21975 [Gemmataceae bacterium]|nr:hypothetical protein [Gemmataceae bacterium]